MTYSTVLEDYYFPGRHVFGEFWEHIHHLRDEFCAVHRTFDGVPRTRLSLLYSDPPPSFIAPRDFRHYLLWSYQLNRLPLSWWWASNLHNPFS